MRKSDIIIFPGFRGRTNFFLDKLKQFALYPFANRTIALKLYFIYSPPLRIHGEENYAIKKKCPGLLR